MGSLSLLGSLLFILGFSVFTGFSLSALFPDLEVWKTSGIALGTCNTTECISEHILTEYCYAVILTLFDFLFLYLMAMYSIYLICLKYIFCIIFSAFVGDL